MIGGFPTQGDPGSPFIGTIGKVEVYDFAVTTPNIGGVSFWSSISSSIEFKFVSDINGSCNIRYGCVNNNSFGTISTSSDIGQRNGNDIHQYAVDTDGNVILMEIDSNPGYIRFIKVTKTGTLVEDPSTGRHRGNDPQVSHDFTYSTAQELIDAYNSATPTTATYTWVKGPDFDTIIGNAASPVRKL